MQRVCAYCHTVMGEKCIRCGSDDPFLIFRDRDFQEFKCPDCGHRWKTGDDPETTGICAMCYQKNTLSR
jgi:DNA-directed RNA polymerase subunit RPC12/RpoP